MDGYLGHLFTVQPNPSPVVDIDNDSASKRYDSERTVLPIEFKLARRDITLRRLWYYFVGVMIILRHKETCEILGESLPGCYEIIVFVSRVGFWHKNRTRLRPNPTRGQTQPVSISDKNITDIGVGIIVTLYYHYHRRHHHHHHAHHHPAFQPTCIFSRPLTSGVPRISFCGYKFN